MTPSRTSASTTAGVCDAAARPIPPTVRVALVGIHGHGRTHLAHAQELQDRGLCRLVAVADPVPPEPGVLDPTVAVFPNLDTLLADMVVDVVILCTPIHTHAALAEAAMRAGADVLLEKPPVPTMAEFRRLEQVCAQTGRCCQIGFQSLASDAVSTLAAAVTAGSLGDVTSITARCAWVRPVEYFRRSRWAGHRELDGIPVMDGALTNPFAHAVATALRIDGSDRAEDVLSVEADLFHANDIDTDDTSTVRVRTRRGTTLLVAATLCSPTDAAPEIVVRGARATAILSYTTDRVRILPPPGHDDPPTDLAGEYGRADLLANLIAHRADPSVELIAGLSTTGAFTAVLEALRTAEPPAAIPSSCVRWEEDGYGRHAVVEGVQEWIRLAAERGQTFTELGAPWTSRADAGRALPLGIGDSVVATYDPGLGVAPTSSPRPFLHPVHTLGGTTVTDAHPGDHDWHLGVGVAVQDVAGWNLWGGPTFVRDRGYRWLSDHGRIEHVRWQDRRLGLAEQDLRWVDANGDTLLNERRLLRWSLPDSTVPGVGGVWLLDLEFTLSTPTARSVRLGSPGAHGRALAGYGGFFWRLPPADELDVRTPDAVGEIDVHGSVSAWLAVALRVGQNRATLVLLPTDPETATNRWFVRVADYPAVGAALAWDAPVTVEKDRPLHRSYRAVIADGTVEPHVLATIGRSTPGAEPPSTPT